MKRLFVLFIAIFSFALIILTITIVNFDSYSGLPRKMQSISSNTLQNHPSEEVGSYNAFNYGKVHHYASLYAVSHFYNPLSSEHSHIPGSKLMISGLSSAYFVNNLFFILGLLLLGTAILLFLLYNTLQARKTAQTTEYRFRTLLEANPSAIMIFQNFRLGFVNSALVDLTGFTREELTQMEIWQLIHPSSLNNPAVDAIDAKNKTFSFRGEFRIITKNQTEKWIDLSTRSIDFYNQPAVIATAIDITERKNTELHIKESELRYKNFFSKNSAIMLIIDPDTGNIQDANQAAINYYGYSREKLVTMNMSHINVLSSMSIKREIVQAKAENRNYYYLKHKLADGSERDVEIYTSMIEVQSTLLSYCIVFDITERRKVEEELKKAKEMAEEATQVKSFFVSNVSHEIRTPLNAIIGLTDLIIEGEQLTSKQMQNMKSIKYSSDHLLGVINDVLDFSKLEAGKVELEKIEFDVYTLINESVKTVEFKANETQIAINTFIDPDVPPVLKGDPSRLRQILLNLLSNAIKFTHEGHVDIQVKILHRGTDKAEIKFSVSDTGIGIPEHKQSQLFQSFTQAESDTSSKYGGTGLGLSISKKLVELQNGRIGLKSIEGMGSTFWFCLNYEISEKTFVPDMTKVSGRIKDLSGVKILMAEDDKMNQFVMKQIIEKWNGLLDIAQNGREAIEKLEKNDYHLVLMDLHMPELNGYEAARKIRNPQSAVLNHDLPIVALTADVTSETRQKVKEAGMNDFITKPSEQDIIYKKIISALRNTKTCFVEKKARPVSKEQPKEQNLEKSKLRIQKALADIFDEDTEATVALIVRFLKEIPRTIVGINEAFYDQDLENLGKLVHKIKPGYSYMGFSEVSDKITQIQELTKSKSNPARLEELCRELDEDSRKIIYILRQLHKDYLSNNTTNIHQKLE
ncbi:MAG: PAS domain-containing sensor histidine kinase [Bacteroidetes bacterium]|nr:MAG: PAS domain-containing sensor histidine kinase [Bacteroidota bacterium]